MTIADDRQDPAERVADDVWVVRMPLDVPYPPFTMTYLLVDRDGGVHVIDPGINRESNLELLHEALAFIDRSPADLRSSTSTHLHRDHTGLGLRLRELYGIPLSIHEEDQRTLDAWGMKPQRALDFRDWGVPDVVADELASLPVGDRRVSFQAERQLVDGDELDVRGFELHVIHTPGHTTGHIVLHDERRQLLFTGDHLLPHIHPGIGLGGAAKDPIGDYVASLGMLERFGEPLVLPGHGYVFEGLQERARITRDHQLRRTDEVAALIEADPSASVWDIAARTSWTDSWDGLTPRNRANALRQTAMRLSMLGLTPGPGNRA